MSPLSRNARWQRIGDAGFVVLVLAVGLLGSVAAWRALGREVDSQRRELLNAIGHSVVGAFELQLVRVLEGLEVGSHLLSARALPTQGEFARFGASLMDASVKLTVLEWQPLVPAAQRLAFEAQAGHEQPGFRIVEPAPDGRGFVPARPREFHLPVLYAWPPADARLGVDISFDPRRLRSKLLARDAGQPMTSETFELIRRDGLAAASVCFAVSAPVYRRSRPDSVPARRTELLGYLTGVVDVRHLMREAAARAEARDLELLVYDRAQPALPIFASAGAQPGALQPEDGVFDVDVGGRTWQAVLRPRPGFSAAAPVVTPLRVLIAGCMATLLVAAAVARSRMVRRRMERTEAALAEDRQHLQNVLDGTAAGTWDWRLDSGDVLINERWAQMLGHTRAEVEPVTHASWAALCHEGDLVAAQQSLDRHLRGEAERYETEFRMRHAQGHWVWVLSIGRVFERDPAGVPLRLAGTHMDITSRKAEEQRLHDDARALEAANRQLRDLAIVDALTGAFNRRHFNDMCLAALAEAQRGQSLALCMLDVDHFKAYNDRHGHQAGDTVLKAIAQTLKDALKRSTDALFRLGGEEFGVIFSAESAVAAHRFVEQLQAALHDLALPHVDSPSCMVTASFGLAWWAAPDATLTPEEMYAEADAALYDAKHAGRDRIVARCFGAGGRDGGGADTRPQAAQA